MITEKIIQDTLLNIGMPASIKGFRYVTQAILYIDLAEEWPKWAELYRLVALKFNEKPRSVEKAITHALQTTRDRNNDYDAICYYIGFDNCENSNSLMKLYLRLKYVS